MSRDTETSDTRFDYVVDLQKDFPPTRVPETPINLTMIETIRTCALRACFLVSGNYERRVGFNTRLGTAFHATLQSFVGDPIRSRDRNLVIAEARRRFVSELALQRAEAESSTRERYLPRSSSRIQSAAEALGNEAVRLVNKNAQVPSQSAGKVLSDRHHAPSAPAMTSGGLPVLSEAEVPVHSADGLFRGRIDRVETDQAGVILFEYKSSTSDDLPDAHSRQVQMYAYLWNQTRGEWPVGAYIVQPLLATQQEIDVNPELCDGIALANIALIKSMMSTKRTSELANPGENCRFCEFRPWCQPFWEWQASKMSAREAYIDSRLGFEGQLKEIRLEGFDWVFSIVWRNSNIRLAAPKERFPHLEDVKSGSQVRVVDAPLAGSYQFPRAKISEYTELFLVDSDASP